MVAMNGTRFLLLAGWLVVFGGAVWLRCAHVAARPMHADEATGARLTAMRMENAGGEFDPKHFHGPLLGDVAAVVCRVRGESTWQEMTKGSLRMVPVGAGLLLVLTPLLGVRRFGAAPMLVAAGLMAASPLLVVYSRMFIHEMLLALFGAAFLFSLGRKGTSWLPGLWLGLMFATKETFVISVLAWGAAAAVVFRKDVRKEWLRPALVNLVVAGVVSFAFYTNGFRHWQGARDAVMTFFTYETVAGHDKPWDYYLRMMVWPLKSAGMWWYATPVTLLAIFGAWRGFREARKWDCFLAISLAGHGVIYSFFGYKTPWLMCLPWVHLCLLAGLAVRGRAMKWAALVAGFALVSQSWQGKRAMGRIESDPRNPFAYVPTRKDVEALQEWLREIRATVEVEPLAVVGRDIWPLPWYLRDFATGYWIELPEGAAKMPALLVVPGMDAASLEATHTVLPRGLRDGVPVLVYLRNDLWEQWTK